MINIIFKCESYIIKPLCNVFNYNIQICEMFKADLRNTSKEYLIDVMKIGFMFNGKLLWFEDKTPIKRIISLFLLKSWCFRKLRSSLYMQLRK